jgi:probable rRNA maturation factor
MANPFELEIDVLIEDERWPDEMEKIITNAIQKAIAHLKLEIAGPAELSILLTDDAHQHQLNAQWREKQSSTNVLSFPQIEPFDAVSGLIGDISLAYETVTKEAQTEAKSLIDHVTHLSVHGFLHILGYDHLTEQEAQEMEALETQILATLEIADPYAELLV